MFIKGSVTQEHIDKGKPKKAQSCPVYFSMKEVLPELDSVLPSGLTINPPGPKWKFVRFPDSIFNKIVEYDQTGKMEPFNYELEI